MLALLDRRHTPGRAAAAAAEAREAGFEHVNLDLIYGTPGETADDFAASLTAAVAAGVDHVSAYSLIVEDGTRLAARVRRGEIAAPDDDVAADRYLAAEATLSRPDSAGTRCRTGPAQPGRPCRHNLLYWRGGDWWGFGPGRAQPRERGALVERPPPVVRTPAGWPMGETPAQARELLTAAERQIEDVMLRLRLAEGLPLGALTAAGRGRGRRTGRGRAARSRPAVDRGRAVLTLRGRLLADAVIRALLP